MVRIFQLYQAGHSLCRSWHPEQEGVTPPRFGTNSKRASKFWRRDDPAELIRNKAYIFVDVWREGMAERTWTWYPPVRHDGIPAATNVPTCGSFLRNSGRVR